MAEAEAEPPDLKAEPDVVEVYSLSGQVLARLPRASETSWESLEEALNGQAEDEDLATAWRIAQTGTLEQGPLFATREPLLPLQEHELDGETYALPLVYSEVGKMSQFASCYSCAAEEDGTSSRRVIFRRVTAPDLRAAERLYNEFIFLSSWRNENFVSVQDLFVARGGGHGDWYCIFDFMQASMASVLRARMRLTAEHVDYFAYNVLRGLQFLHRLGCAHGNVCPSNVWVNTNDDVQLSHLCYMHAADTPALEEASEEVREFYSSADSEWLQHSPPEVLEARSLGGAPGDMWAMGCFIAEMLHRRTLLPGTSLEDQRHRIGQLEQELLTQSPADAVQHLCSEFGGQDLSPAAAAKRMETVLSCLAISPDVRLTAEAAFQASSPPPDLVAVMMMKAGWSHWTSQKTVPRKVRRSLPGPLSRTSQSCAWRCFVSGALALPEVGGWQAGDPCMSWVAGARCPERHSVRTRARARAASTLDEQNVGARAHLGP
ncbi:mpkC [Symbiodinium natans]|uniref:MpkC protein n=1 Tax=Symbiodinium natans TaxID=878477 RepID=A0A812JS36_9DINO|nr:mpkC [Symbiodinium natans]